MKMQQTKRRVIVWLLVLAMALSVTGCTATAAAGQNQSDTKAADQPPAGDKQAILDYLKAAKNDLKLIDEILADKDIGLLEEETASEGEELAPELIEEYEGVLSGYTDQIAASLSGISKRTAPNLPDIANFQAAEKAVFQTLDSILQEYSQTLSYASTILQVGEDISGLENIQETDLQAIYDAYSAGIGEMIAALEAASVPTFLASFNADFIEAFKQLDSTVYYALSAIAIDDPLRADAAEYLMGIMVRNVDSISQEWEQELADRQYMLSEDAKAVATTAEGLKSWLDTNIASLEGQ
jgi:hypothetical protein